MRLRNLIVAAGAMALTVFTALAQTGSIEGDIKGQDGKPLVGAQVKIVRTDIKGEYKVKTDKKGHYLYAGLPSGMQTRYTVSVNAGGKDITIAQGVPNRGGDPTNVSADLSKVEAAGEGQAAAAAAPQQEQARGLSAAEKAALEKQNKEREEQLKKNKELNDTFNAGISAAQNKQWDEAITNFNKAAELGPTQHVIFAQLAEAEMSLAGTKSGAEADAATQKGLDAYAKAIELSPNDAGYHNNYALALAKAKKYSEAQGELTKAATLDPPNAGRYYYNLGALLVNAGQNDQAGEAFKKAIDTDPNYADAQYQYGVTLLAKASIAPDGKVTPVPGTAEAFQKYLALKPDGPFADSAKSMLATLGATVDTSYKNPTSAGKKGGKK